MYGHPSFKKKQRHTGPSVFRREEISNMKAELESTKTELESTKQELTENNQRLKALESIDFFRQQVVFWRLCIKCLGKIVFLSAFYQWFR